MWVLERKVRFAVNHSALFDAIYMCHKIVDGNSGLRGKLVFLTENIGMLKCFNILIHIIYDDQIILVLFLDFALRKCCIVCMLIPMFPILEMFWMCGMWTTSISSHISQWLPNPLCNCDAYILWGFTFIAFVFIHCWMDVVVLSGLMWVS